MECFSGGTLHVFKGPLSTVIARTPSLYFGYCNLKLNPATDSHLRIALTGAPIDMPPENAVVEIAGKIDASGNQPLGKPGRPILSLIEAEIYASAP